MTTDALRRAIAENVENVLAPPADLAAVRLIGRRISHERRVCVAVALVAVGALMVTAAVLGSKGSQQDKNRVIDPIGALDFSDGLRAVASPDGGQVYLAGRRFSADDLPDGIDTSAAVTAVGVVFYRGNDPYLLDSDGEVRQLEVSTTENRQVRPTSKSDGTDVAYAMPTRSGVEVVVQDLATSEDLGRRTFPCRRRACEDVVLEALDRGAVFVRTRTGTMRWDLEADRVELFSSPGTRVVDVRNGVVLYGGARPGAALARDYQLVRGAVDGQLTLDGRYVLAWSSRLIPTSPGIPPITLAEPRALNRTAFWTMDTDGTVLVAVPARHEPVAKVYDCPVSREECQLTVAKLDIASGDPVFIGADM